MQQRQLGTSGDTISAVGLGCMGMSDFYGAAEDATSIEVIHRALDLGITLFDTADMYGVGSNETLVGRALTDRRASTIIATKFGNVRAPDGRMLGVNGTPSYVREACDASLRRLGLAEIDLYYQHRVDPDTPIEDTVGAMADLVREGKVRYLGLSEASPQTISLGRGFLTGAIKSPDDLADDDWRRQNPRFQGENFTRNLDLVHAIEQMAEAKAARPRNWRWRGCCRAASTS